MNIPFLCDAFDSFKIIDQISSFSVCNGGSYVNIYFQSRSEKFLAKSLWTKLSHSGGRKVRVVPFMEAENKPTFFNVIILYSLNEGLNSTLQLISNHTVKSCLIFYTSSLTEDDWTFMKQLLSERSDNYLFYIASMQGMDNNSLTWHLILTIKGQTQVVVNELEFYGKNNEIILI